MNKEQPASGPQQSRHDRGQPHDREQGPGRRPARRRRMIVGAAVAVITAAGATAVSASGVFAGPGAGSGRDATTAPRHHGTTATLTRLATGTAAAAATRGTPPLAAGQQGTRLDVPWSQVGPGWVLATTTKTKSGGASTLFLVDPAGGRYRLATLPAQTANSSQPDYVVAWSGDGQRALIGNTRSSQVEVLNLRTGKAARFTLRSGMSPLGFTRPDGLAILAATITARPHLERFSLTGAPEQAYPTSYTGGSYYSGNSAVYSPDGSELAVTTSGAMELLSNGGKVIRALPVSRSAQYCSPVRWWNATELLAMCMPPRSGVSQLWLVPASGARATALTASPAARGDVGDLNAWPMPSGTYVHDAGGCGYTYLAKLQANRQTAPVKVPGVPQGDSVIPIGSYGDQLAIQATAPCGPGSSLLWYSAARGTTTALLGGTAPGGGSVSAAFLFGVPASDT